MRTELEKDLQAPMFNDLSAEGLELHRALYI